MATAPPRTLVPNASLPAKIVPVQPNQTLYIRGLPSSKVKKQDLRTALYMLFSTYGPVLDVIALKTNGMRGQAHIVYRDIQTSTQAMRSLQGSEFLGGKLRIEYAKGKSHAISRLDGSFETASSGAAAVEVTELQQSIFNAPGPNNTSAGVPAPSIQGLPPSTPPANTAGADGPVGAIASPAPGDDSRGQKRPREDEEEDDSDVAMEEDSDDD